MNEQQLITFIEVARKKHFRMAADSLNLTQPAVSAQIRSLEDEIGASLFHRSQVKLTSAGTLFLPYAQQILELMRESRSVISEHGEKLSDPISIGTTPCLSLAILPRLMKYFQSSHPHLPLRFMTLPTDEMLQLMNEGQIDLGIAYETSTIPSHIETKTLFYDSFILITSPEQKDAHSLSYIQLKGLEKWPLITFAPSTTERKILNSLFQRFQFQPHIIIELTSVEEIKRLVADGYGVALVPQVAVDANQPQLRRVRITQFEHSIPVLLYVPIKRYPSRTVQQLIHDISGVYPVDLD